MNPFLKPTVATPQPDAHWGAPVRHRRPHHMPVPKSAGLAGATPAGSPAQTVAGDAPASGVAADKHDTDTPRESASPAATLICWRGLVLHRDARPRPASRPWRRAAHYLGTVAVAACLLLPGLATAVDINSATAQELQQVKGIGPKMAQVIIEERQRGGRFESMTDISERVKGVGPKKAASFQAAGLTVGGIKAAAPSDSKTPATGAVRGRRAR